MNRTLALLRFLVLKSGGISKKDEEAQWNNFITKGLWLNRRGQFSIIRFNIFLTQSSWKGNKTIL